MIRQTPRQLYDEWSNRAWRCYDVHHAASQRLTDDFELDAIVNEYRKYAILANLMQWIIKRNSVSY